MDSLRNIQMRSKEKHNHDAYYVQDTFYLQCEKLKLLNVFKGTDLITLTGANRYCMCRWSTKYQSTHILVYILHK